MLMDTDEDQPVCEYDYVRRSWDMQNDVVPNSITIALEEPF